MKGLLIKDFKLFKTQRLFIGVILGICIMFCVRGEQMSTVITYASAVLSLLVINTVGYDEHDNGMSFLFTLPISRGKYVLEKYVLGVLMAAAAFIAGSVAVLAVGAAGSLPFGAVQGVLGGSMRLSFGAPMWLEAVFSSLLTSTLIISIALPVQLKFGSEKGRIVMFGMVIFFVLAASAVKQAAAVSGIDFSGAVEWIMQADAVQVAVCLSVLMIGLLGVSFCISLAVMRRKQL